ncbi:Methyltransferase [Penicillium ucsense]|uniref:Methyltransferase n=1 Tax=Penicillium ucsense TaxID=2839758 RepID=A0A8J8WDA1_9EURO|nr:Methyltransferase [Penicillium ucsense]KAF7729598.1 Methyltransferase [Penicillium ucsense]
MSSHAKSWEKIFKDDQFVKQYKTGEQVTGRFAQLLIDQSGMVADSGSDTPLVVLDNGCGTGVVSSLLQDQIKRNMQLTCGDISQGMLDMVKARRDEEGWQHAHIEMIDAQSSGLPPSHFTHVIASFVFMALPSPLAALDDATRILRPGGTLAFSTWIEPGWLGVMQKCIKTISEDLPWPTASQFLETVNNGKWNSVEWIISELKKRGYEDINVRPVTEHVSLGVPQFEEMSMTMFSMVSKAFWTEQQRENHSNGVRPAMKEYLETTYGCNGQIPMEWTAIMSTARKSN